ncbi:transposase, partial [Arsenicicoccus sp. MKL-02]|nr:transposase [Arsenicicoccus cauae]
EALPRSRALPTSASTGRRRQPRPRRTRNRGLIDLTIYRSINALMECVIGLFKTECIRTTVFHPGPYRTLAEVEYATAGWVDWYNTTRLHSTLGMMTPVEYEQAHYAALIREPQPV